MKNVPIKIFLYDLLYFKEPVVDEPIIKRREILENAVDTSIDELNKDDFYNYCLKPAIHRRDIIRQQCSYIDTEGSFAKPMPNFSVK